MQKNTAQGARLTKPNLRALLAIQCSVLLIIVILLFIFGFSELTIISTCSGALIFIGPNAYFSYYAFRYSGAKAASYVAQSFYRGEAGKFVLTAVLFALLFSLIKPIDVVAVFLVYVFMMVLTWIAALRIIK